MGNFMSSFPLTKDVKPAKPPSHIQRLREGWRGASYFWKVSLHPSRASAAQSPTRHAPNACGGARLLRPNAKASTYAAGPSQKTISGSTLITAAITRMTSPGTQARQGRERHALSGLVIDRHAQARYRLNFVNNFGE
jgi:hypothetical protein